MNWMNIFLNFSKATNYFQNSCRFVQFVAELIKIVTLSRQARKVFFFQSTKNKVNYLPTATKTNYIDFYSPKANFSNASTG